MSVLAPLSAVRASAKASTRSCEHTGPHAFAMTRSRNSRRGSSYSHWSSRFYTGSHTRPKTRDLWEDLHFDPWEQAEHADAEVEASGFAKYFGEEQLWTALSAVTATQLPSDPCSDDWESASDRWTLVSAAESSWVVEWETDGAQTAALLAPWPEEDVSDDAAIAAQLQDDERMSAGVGRFVIGRRTLGCRRPTRLPVDGLVARMGVCVVCSESVATVLMEPCGHLALCGACSASWNPRGSTCVLCRCPGERIHLLSRSSPDLLGSESLGVNVRLGDGLVTIPSIEIAQCALELRRPWSTKTKLQRRRAKNRYSRERRQRVSTGDPTLAGGVHGKRALEAQADLEWQHWHGEVARWRRARNHCRAVLRELGPHPFRGNAGQQNLSIDSLRSRLTAWAFEGLHGLWHYPVRPYRRRATRVECLIAQAKTAPRPALSHFNFLGAVARAKSHHRERTRGGRQALHLQKEALQNEALQKEWHRQERQEQEAEALLAATRAAFNATRRLQEPLECAACGQAEACMMHLPCRHVALCQRCFDTTWQANAPCARCGTVSHISLRVRRA